MATSKDYYDILGVDKSSTPEQIKQAYRKLAREHHPDMVGADKKDSAEKRFKEINEAYQVLSDPQKKQQYDQFGQAGMGNGASGFGGQHPGGQWGPFSYTYTSGQGGAQGFGGFDPFDIFEEVFGFRGFGGQRRPQRGKDLHYELQVDFADAVKGAEREIKIESGTVKVKIPAGIRTGIEIKFPGKGMPGPQDLPAGDLYLNFRVMSPREFQVSGSNIGLALEVDFADAILGTTLEVPVVDPKSSNGVGKVKMKVPAGTQHGQQIRLKGHGMPELRGSGRGDVIAQVFIALPKKISKKQKQLLEEYRVS